MSAEPAQDSTVRVSLKPFSSPRLPARRLPRAA